MVLFVLSCSYCMKNKKVVTLIKTNYSEDQKGNLLEMISAHNVLKNSSLCCLQSCKLDYERVKEANFRPVSVGDIMLGVYKNNMPETKNMLIKKQQAIVLNLQNKPMAGIVNVKLFHSKNNLKLEKVGKTDATFLVHNSLVRER